MKKIILSTVALASLAVASEYKYEVTPMVGYVDTKEHVDLKNHKVAGIAVSFNKGDDCKFDQIELGILQTISDADYENSSDDTSITRAFVNGVKEYALNDKFKLYALAGLGYEHINTNLNHNDSDPFFNYGIGAKYKVYNDVALKFDVRHLLKFDGDKNVMYTLGVAIPFGEKANKVIDLDSDNDGVLDSNDNCPNTKAGVEVGSTGCEIIVKIDKDLDNDGVMDSVDSCLNTAQGVKVDASGCEIVEKIIVKPASLGVLFDTNSAKLRSYDIAKFDKYIKYVSTVAGSKIVVEGHTDSVGSSKYNLALSQKRAQSVKVQFIKMGVDANKIETIGYGESKPAVDNKTKENRQINRRVTAKIVK
ncbi:MAG: OmpA family protein [Campylobacterota bacterium]|nr:OmpA family protein [Campylobacterota bacterium]